MITKQNIIDSINNIEAEIKELPINDKDLYAQKLVELRYQIIPMQLAVELYDMFNGNISMIHSFIDTQGGPDIHIKRDVDGFSICEAGTDKSFASYDGRWRQSGRLISRLDLARELGLTERVIHLIEGAFRAGI